MKRRFFCLLSFALAMQACKTAGPQATAVAVVPADLQAYVGQLRILRHPADKARIRLSEANRRPETCAVAVQVNGAARDRGALRFSLMTLGVPRIAGRRLDCRRMVPQLELTLADQGGGAPALDAVLQTAEAYLASQGVGFDTPPAKAPSRSEVACREAFATHDEARLARDVKTWPEPLLSIDVWRGAPKGVARQEGEIELQAVVAGDGRLHRPRVTTALSDAHASTVVRSLELWRFTPARTADGPCAARVTLRPILRIY